MAGMHTVVASVILTEQARPGHGWQWNHLGKNDCKNVATVDRVQEGVGELEYIYIYWQKGNCLLFNSLNSPSFQVR